MGLISTLKNALGLNTPVVPRDPEPLRLSDDALARLESLPDGHGIHVATRRAARGRLVAVEEGEAQGPPPAGYTRMTIGDRDLQRLRGLVLDYKQGGWHVSTHLELRAKETPNPNGRLYLCNRFLAEGRTFQFTKAQADEGAELPDLAAFLLDIPGAKSALVRDNTVTIERVPNATWDRIDAGVDTALRSYFLSAGHRLTAEQTAAPSGGLEDEVRAVLAERIIPAIQSDGGDLQLVSIDDGVVFVELQGACRSCPASTMTLKQGVERTLLEAFPNRIRAVEQV
jgi:Fe-S cluster biogenesis protein NfuA